MNFLNKKKELKDMRTFYLSKKTNRFTKFFAATLILMVFACSSDDDSSGSNDGGINAQNLIANFNENPTNGDIVGILQAVGDGALSFSITSQTPSGALAINPSTGELTVVNSTLFDFETNPVIAADISILSATDTATATANINLNNLDDIESFLSTSKADYIAATDGDWVIITEAEYNNLAGSLNGVTKVATSDSDYNSTSPNIVASADVTVANDNGITMPNGSYVFAFKYNSHNDAISGAKVKQSSTSATDGYTDLGSTLPTHDSGENYFAMKGSNSPTTNSVCYLATYANNSINFKNISGNNPAIGNGDTNTLPITQADATLLYQGLSTTQKQW